MKTKSKIKQSKIIYDITISGHKVLFIEDANGVVEYYMSDRISEEVYDAITGYMISEGIFEEIYGKEHIDSIINSY